jgi:hypothetical protein
MQEIELIKHPYLGYSQNLIESFMIIGFEKETIETELLQTTTLEPRSTFRPKLINKITSPSYLNMLDDEVIISLIFPSEPQITTNTAAETESSTIIFFLNADTLQDGSKIPFHGCGYIFYEAFSYNEQKYYVPKCFCIISQFPYFTLFSCICKDILINFRSKNEIPLEIMIFNIVNFIPSPLNSSINLSTFPSKELFTYASKFNQISRISTLSYNYQVFQLSGYPVLDINISELFNVLPTNMLIEILIFNFLEYDMLFFSKNLEILNLTMYIIQVLNYPCTDSLYLWHILSVSELDLFNTDSKFVGKPWSTMLGVNCTYDSKVNTSKVLDAHFVVDIDNKNFFFKFENTEDEDSQKTDLLHKYIKKIIKEQQLTQSSFLSRDIKSLIKELDIISKQVIHSRNSSLYSILSNNSFGSVKFFESNDKIRILNKNIQEVFYTFILKLLMIYYNNYHLNSYFNINSDIHNLKLFINYNEDLSKLSKEEVIFYERFKSSSKYNNYILNYIQEHKCIDLYRIPLLFSEEFIYLTKFNEEKLNFRFFDTIDYIYEAKKPILVTFTHFFTYYDSFIREEIYKKIDSQIIKKSESVLFERPSLLYEYDYCKLDESVITYYKDFLTTLEPKKLEEIFPSIITRSQNVLKKTKFSDIIDLIERALISHKIIKTDSLILFSLLNIFLVTRYKCSFSDSISHLRDILETIDSRSMFLRKYLNQMLTIYNLNIPNVSENELKQATYSKTMCSFIIINFLRHKNILPNEEMMNIFKLFVSAERNEDEDLLNSQDSDDDFNICYLEDFHLFFQYHVCRCGAKKPEYFLKQTENSSFEGDVYLDCFFCGTKEVKTNLVFKFEISEERYNSEIYSPLKLFNLSVKMFKEFVQKNFNYDELDKDSLRKIIINLIFYCKHNNITHKFLLRFLYGLH